MFFQIYLKLRNTIFLFFKGDHYCLGALNLHSLCWHRKVLPHRWIGASDPNIRAMSFARRGAAEQGGSRRTHAGSARPRSGSRPLGVNWFGRGSSAASVPVAVCSSHYRCTTPPHFIRIQIWLPIKALSIEKQGLIWLFGCVGFSAPLNLVGTFLWIRPVNSPDVSPVSETFLPLPCCKRSES
jgi:hypothetical protein